MPTTRRSRTGFTLVELMIVVAIVAILAAVAYPSYTEHTRKSHRADAQTLLMDIGQRQQQYLLDTRGYAAGLSDLNVQPSGSLAGRYTVTLTVGTAGAPAFTATATPLGSQARDKCGTLTLDQRGAKSPAGCW